MPQPSTDPVGQLADSTQPNIASVLELHQTRTSWTYCFLVLSKSGMYNTTIEKDFGCVGYAIESLESFVKFIVVIMSQGSNPGFNFL